MSARYQYHATVYAEVDEAGRVVGWGVCEPGSEPVDSDEAVFDTATEQWVPNTDDERSWPLWDAIDSALDAAVRDLDRKAKEA